MSEDKIFKSVQKRWKEVMVVPPQTMGPLTPIYKKVIPFFKVYPWRVVGVFSVVLVVFLYFLLGPLLVRITSILQKGF